MIVNDEKDFVEKALERTSEEWLTLARRSIELENFVYYLALSKLRKAVEEKDAEKQHILTQYLMNLSSLLQD